MDPAVAKEQAMLSHLQTMTEVMALGDSDIQRFYRNVAVFVTGGSGFMGKLLIEKLFRSCKIRKMFLLMRPKKGRDVHERLTEILKDPVFDVIRRSQPGFQERIVVVEGDVAMLRLGISDADWKAITEEVTVIFHGAATIRFDEPLQRAALTNVRGTREALYLAKACNVLQSFVYVSTAYSHATVSRIGGEVLEQFYPVAVPPHTVIQLAESMAADRLNDIADSLLEDWPNTYCFTKSLAEDLVRTVGEGLPVCIVRPAIVIGAYQEPSPGWIDPGNLYGASGLGLGFTMGVIHVVYAKPNVKIDFVAADFVNNAIIAAARETGRRWNKGEREIKIYTVTSARNHLTWAECIRALNNEVKEIVSPKALWYTYTYPTGNTVVYGLLSFFLHHIPATVVDGACVLLGKPPMLRPLYEKVHKISSVLKHFTLHEWSFSDDNLQRLYQNMTENDKVIFNFEFTTISTTNMLVVWALGLRKYILKDGLKGTQYGVKKQKLYLVLTSVVFFVYVSVFWVIAQFVLYLFDKVFS